MFVYEVKRRRLRRALNFGLLLFLTFRVLVANPKKPVYMVANPARGLLNKEKGIKGKVWHRTHPPHAARSEKIKYKSRDASTCLGATQVSVRLTSVQGFLRLVSYRSMGVASQKSTLPGTITISQYGCVSLLLAMSSRVYLLFTPRGHEPPPTLRDSINPHLTR